MADTTKAEEFLFRRSGLNRDSVEVVVDDALLGTDDGEMFLEYRQSESFDWDDGRLKSASFDTSQGFGLRAVVGESTGYAHASELSMPAMRRAGYDEPLASGLICAAGSTAQIIPPSTVLILLGIMLQDANTQAMLSQGGFNSTQIGVTDLFTAALVPFARR